MIIPGDVLLTPEELSHGLAKRRTVCLADHLYLLLITDRTENVCLAVHTAVAGRGGNHLSTPVTRAVGEVTRQGGRRREASDEIVEGIVEEGFGVQNGGREQKAVGRLGELFDELGETCTRMALQTIHRQFGQFGNRTAQNAPPLPTIQFLREIVDRSQPVHQVVEVVT